MPNTVEHSVAKGKHARRDTGFSTVAKQVRASGRITVLRCGNTVRRRC